MRSGARKYVLLCAAALSYTNKQRIVVQRFERIEHSKQVTLYKRKSRKIIHHFLTSPGTKFRNLHLKIIVCYFPTYSSLYSQTQFYGIQKWEKYSFLWDITFNTSPESVTHKVVCELHVPNTVPRIFRVQSVTTLMAFKGDFFRHCCPLLWNVERLGMYSMGIWEMRRKFWQESLKRRRRSQFQGIRGRIQLQLILEKQGVNVDWSHRVRGKGALVNTV